MPDGRIVGRKFAQLCNRGPVCILTNYLHIEWAVWRYPDQLDGWHERFFPRSHCCGHMRISRWRAGSVWGQAKGTELSLPRGYASRKVVGLYLERPLWLTGGLKSRFGYSDLKEAAGNRLAMEFECR